MKMKRKPISKKMREDVYKKYGGHCAYCGCILEMKDMQVDHLHSLYGNNRGYDVVDDFDSLDNLMPSCRQCNYYKGGMKLESFRRELKSLMSRVKKPFIYRLAEKYNMIEEIGWDGQFYFEKLIR